MSSEMPPKPRGRPPLVAGEESVPVSTSVPRSVYRVLKKISDARGGNVADTVRRVLIGRLSDKKTDQASA